MKLTTKQARELGLDVPRPSRKRPKAKVDQKAFQKAFTAACEAHGIPKPFFEWQFCFERKWRWDVAWGSLNGQVALEIQGALFSQGRHCRGAALLKEHEKLNQGCILNWRVLFCTPQQVESGEIFPVIKRALR